MCEFEFLSTKKNCHQLYCRGFRCLCFYYFEFIIKKNISNDISIMKITRKNLANKIEAILAVKNISLTKKFLQKNVNKNQVHKKNSKV